MKSIRTILALSALAVSLCLSAKAQTVVPLLTGGTANIAAATSNIYNTPFSVAYGRLVTIQMSANIASGATSNIWFYVDQSADGTTWKTNAHTLGIGGGGFLLAQTNIDVGAMPFFSLRSIYNTNTVSITNLKFSVTTKRGI